MCRVLLDVVLADAGCGGGQYRGGIAQFVGRSEIAKPRNDACVIIVSVDEEIAGLLAQYRSTRNIGVC